MTSRPANVVKEYPIITFFVLAYAFSWWPWPLYGLGLSPGAVIGFGPFLAALVVVALTRGKVGILELLRRMVRWRVGSAWYAAALLLPVGIALGATVLNVLLGARPPSSAELGAWPGLIPTYFLLLLIPGIGGAWEEPGWRGYALPKLQVGRSALVASLIVGVVWAFWHLPLMVEGVIPWSDLAYVTVQSVVYAWLFNNTGGSVLLVMLFHTMNNVVSGGFFRAMFSGADWARMGWLLVALWCAVAVVLVVANGPEHLSHKHGKQVERATEPMVDKPTSV
ncbi:MAG: CPBP family intramembrane glutamic endopeptidase [Rubrobacter sp.]